MVGGVVKEPVGILSPVRLLLGEHRGEPREKHQHHVAVCIELGQAQVEVPLRVDSRDHVDPVAERLGGDGVRLAALAPLLVPEVEVGQPGLVNVDDPAAVLEQLKHLLGVEHAGHQAPLGVALVGDLLEHAVPHVVVVSKHPGHLVLLDLQVVAFLEVPLDLLDSPDVPVVAEGVLNDGSNLGTALLSGLCLRLNVLDGVLLDLLALDDA